MSRRIVSVLVVAAFAVAALVSAGAGAAHAAVHSKPVAQASPSGAASPSVDPCATVFDRVCDPAEQRGFNESQEPLPPGSDPPGAMVRSLAMIVLLAVGFFVYVGWALQRGAPPA